MKQIFLLYFILSFVQYIKSSTIQVLSEYRNSIEKNESNYTIDLADFHNQMHFRDDEKIFSKDFNIFNLKKVFSDEVDFFINKNFNVNKNSLKNEIIPKEMYHDLDNNKNNQNFRYNIPKSYLYLKSYRVRKEVSFYFEELI